MPSEHYIVGNVIGKGSYGEVTLASHKKDKKKYVIKKIDLQNASKKERNFAQQEVEILSKLRHPNIVSYKESFQTDEGFLSIVMGFCEGGDLYARLKKQGKTGEYLSETQTVEWFVQIAMALQYMHDRHILHRDLKTQNVFLTKSKIIKLGDLGIARVLDNNADMATTMIGTPYYMSPELFSNKPYNHKSDVWALGCCVYEMATLKHAFNAKDMNALVYKILKGKTPPMPTHYSKELQDIIKAMLDYEPAQRPSASRILRHPFIKKHIAIFLEGTKNRRRNKDEKVKKCMVKSDDSGYSESSADIQGIATASNVDIEVMENDDRNNIVSSDKMTNKSRGKELENEKNVSDESRNPSRPVSAKKVLSEKIQAKAKLKKLEQKRLDENLETPPVETSERKKHKNNIQSNSIEKISQKSNMQSSNNGLDKKRGKNIQKSRRPLPVCPTDDWKCESCDQERKLPLPRFTKKTDSDDSTKAIQDSPKLSSGVPNMAARKKRRQKQQESESKIVSPPVITKRDSIISIVDSYTPRSCEEIVREHIQRISHSESKDCVDGESRSKNMILDEIPSDQSSKQTSYYDSGNEDDELSKNENKNEEVACLIDNLQTTLKLEPHSHQESNNGGSSSEEGEDSPSATGRLNDRIHKLRRECIDALGEKILNKAYAIIDNKPENKIEGALIALIGQKNFDLYSGQIWQLKFCEEFKM